MTADQNVTTAPLTAAAVETELTAFLAEKIGSPVQRDQDLFASGLVSSMFAMQLVVQLESEYDIAIVGPELKLDNFRTVTAMTGLVLRLRATDEGAAAGA